MRTREKADGAQANGDAGGEREESLVVSGGMKGGEEIEGKPAVLDVPLGKGRVVAFNFDPIHRLVTRSDFRLVWNLILNWNDLPPPLPNPADTAFPEDAASVSSARARSAP